jgi:hypothetical protein
VGTVSLFTFAKLVLFLFVEQLGGCTLRENLKDEFGGAEACDRLETLPSARLSGSQRDL